MKRSGDDECERKKERKKERKMKERKKFCHCYIVARTSLTMS